jgi:sugar-specific transcriptional regulator TrmB
MNSRAEQHLIALGFSEMEAMVYCALLQLGGSTGYKVAKAIGRAGANTYQALGTLHQKGAVVSADGAGKIYRAVPPEELLTALTRAHEAQVRDAAEALRGLETAPPDDALYQLTTVAQAEERARRLIETAEQIVLFDLFPGPFAKLRGLLEAAEARGVTVAGVVYGDTSPRPAAWVNYEGHVISSWIGEGMILVADARQHVVSLLSKDGETLLNGVWSDSPYLCCIQHSNLAAEIRMVRMRVNGPLPFDEISLFRAKPPGLALLQARRP